MADTQRQPVDLLVDPAVSSAKLEAEVALFREREDEYRRRGCWLTRIAPPLVELVFAAPQLTPPAVVFGARLDFTNFDFWPASVQLVNPFTGDPYRFSELPTKLPQQAVGFRGADPPPELLAAIGALPGAQLEIQYGPQALMQAVEPDDIPFLCLRGVREYHENPGHSGDPWLLHRGTGRGSLIDLVEQLLKYGVAPLSGYAAQLAVRVVGLQQTEVPA